MSDLPTHVQTCINARRLFRNGQRILVAVSGGLDSMALLHLLRQLAKTRRWKLTVAHFNHQLRGAASDADERLARQTARKLRLPFVVARGDVRGLARKSGLSLEMAARKLRHGFLAATAKKLKIPTIALAHHADDQLELFFLRLLRGAGGAGLAGMNWSNPSPSAPKIRLARPLLDTPKAALQAFTKEKKIPFSEDTSNASLDIQRNRIRHELLPLLTKRYQPALGTIIPRVMDLAGSEADFATRAAAQWLKGGRRPAFAHLHPAVQRRVVHQQLLSHKLLPDFDLVERLRRKPGLWINVSAACSVSRDESGRIRLQKLESLQFSPQARKFSLSSKKREISFGGVRICCQITDDNGTSHAIPNANVEYFDADKVGAAICLRHWQPGDRFQPIGTGSAGKLQDLFTNLKVPRAERRRRVVAASARGELFWVEGLRMAEKFKLDEKTARQLKWSWRRHTGPLSS